MNMILVAIDSYIHVYLYFAKHPFMGVIAAKTGLNWGPLINQLPLPNVWCHL